MALALKIITFSDSSFKEMISSIKEEVIVEFQKEDIQALSNKTKDTLAKQLARIVGKTEEETLSLMQYMMPEEMKKIEAAASDFLETVKKACDTVQAKYDKNNNLIVVSSPMRSILIQITPFSAVKLTDQGLTQVASTPENAAPDTLTRSVAAMIIAKINNKLAEVNGFEAVEV